jgi:AcrR family transcriptional regulator
MEWQLQPKMNTKLFLRDPEQSEIGKRILKSSTYLIKTLGFEAFTFKKLADEISTTEATVYRYFENKHRLLSYIVAWYWNWLDYQVMFSTNNVKEANVNLKTIAAVLTWQLGNQHASQQNINLEDLHDIIIAESSKVYLTKHVTEDNKEQLFKPYKNLCQRISEVILAYSPNYPFPKSLASTVVEMAHYQDFFMKNLPSLTDFGNTKSLNNVQLFIEQLLFSSLSKETT